jgi:hypothetical protein
MPVLTRLKKRVKDISVLSSANNIKFPKGNTHIWVTEPPKMFISGFEHSIQNGVGIINYTKYKLDKNGNKYIDKRYHDFVDASGNTTKRLIDAKYVLDELVIERIEKFKPIKIEKHKFD